MSTNNPVPGVTLTLPTAPPSSRSAFGWPPGSIRALLTLMIAALVSAHLLMPVKDPIVPIPSYLIYLLLLILGHYFAARSQPAPGYTGPAPLYLPRGTVRLLIFACLVGSIVYKLATTPEQLKELFTASVATMRDYPELPLVLLGGFFLGVFCRVVVFRGKPPVFWQDFEAWIALIAVVGIGLAAILHLVINPNVQTENRVNWPDYERFLTAVIAFYFGDR